MSTGVLLPSSSASNARSRSARELSSSCMYSRFRAASSSNLRKIKNEWSQEIKRANAGYPRSSARLVKFGAWATWAEARFGLGSPGRAWAGESMIQYT
jgi:hypothetical protein